MAILTALLVSPVNGQITIHTDSQAAIDSFHKSINLSSISPRRYNKIDNNILCTSIHYIIRELKLKISFKKVKAHSGDAFNDIADQQAKIGHLHAIPTKILHNHLSNQVATLMWNNQIPIDRDVRKCIGTIVNYKRLIGEHLNHSNPKDIKEFTANSVINWSVTSKWFNYNDRSTHKRYSMES
ncbi:unnamed protein product [Rhizophagus irregularis]|nr:unnamed protein product [Rhizophagus irregularis]